MPLRPELYVPFIYLLPAVIYAWLGLFAWRRRPAVAVTPFAWTMLGMAVWSFTYGLEIFSPSLETKLLFSKIEFIGIVSIPVFLLIFSLEFIGKSHLIDRRARLFLWVIPFLILALVWTNPYHHLVWDRESLHKVGGLVLLSFRYRVFFWVELGYSYLLVLVAGLLLIMEMVQRPGVYRIQVSLIVIGILAPWLGSLIFIAKINPINNLDFTPLFFLPTGLGLSWAIWRYRLLEMLPLEHLTVLKNMTDGVIVVNQNKRVLYINALIKELLGCSETDVLGQPLNYISTSYGDMIACSKDRSEITIGENPQAKVFEVNIAAVIPETTPKQQDGPDQMIVLHDITERKKAETALSRRETMMSAIGLTAEQFLRASSWEQNIPGVLEKFGQAANVSRAYVFMNYQDENNTIFTSLCYEWTAPGISSQLKNQNLQHVHLRAAGLKRWVAALSAGDPIQGLLGDFPQSEQDALKGREIFSLAVLPIFVDNHWWGFIGFDECTHERYWTGTELESLHIAASILGSAETRARTEQKLIRRQEALNLLHDIVRQALQAKSLRLMAEALAERLAKLISAKECFITLWDETNKKVIPLASNSTDKDTSYSLQPVSADRTFTELALELGHSLTIDDTYNSQYIKREIVLKSSIGSLIVLPLIAEKEKIGAIILAFGNSHNFQPDEVTICEQASSLITLAFDKFKVMERAQRRADVSESLRKASAIITETLETDEAITRILEQLKQMVPYESASVQFLIGNELEIVGGSGFADPKSVLGIRFSIPGDNPNTIVMESGKPCILHEVDEKYNFFNEISKIHIRSWLGVPLIFQDRIIGLLAIDSSKPNHFTQEDSDIASVFADQVAVSLENARIFEEAQSQAITDALTGLFNRRGLFQIGEFEFLRARRINRPFSAFIFDIDRFKKVNDQYGHATGDQILRSLAERCRTGSRAVDLVGRYGGEEFVVLLPETNLEAARLVAERLRQVIMKDPFATDTGQLDIRISIGVAESDETDTLKTLIEKADMALYEAKRSGRNRVVVNETVHVRDQI
jgi:diguanylate cyclase (GGDEF)-like protein/PAS domain S-box-containing protein